MDPKRIKLSISRCWMCDTQYTGDKESHEQTPEHQRAVARAAGPARAGRTNRNRFIDCPVCKIPVRSDRLRDHNSKPPHTDLVELQQQNKVRRREILRQFDNQAEQQLAAVARQGRKRQRPASPATTAPSTASNGQIAQPDVPGDRGQCANPFFRGLIQV